MALVVAGEATKRASARQVFSAHNRPPNVIEIRRGGFGATRPYPLCA